MVADTECSFLSFAYMEMSTILAKMHFTYELELVDKRLDWEEQSHMHIMWWKPELKVQITSRVVAEIENM